MPELIDGKVYKNVNDLFEGSKCPCGKEITKWEFWPDHDCNSWSWTCSCGLTIHLSAGSSVECSIEKV